VYKLGEVLLFLGCNVFSHSSRVEAIIVISSLIIFLILLFVLFRHMLVSVGFVVRVVILGIRRLTGGRALPITTGANRAYWTYSLNIL
jgi:hypothetical protein